MPLDPNVQHLLRPFQGVDLGEIQNFKIRQAQEQRLADEAAFAREKYGFERQQVEQQQEAQRVYGEGLAASVDTDEVGHKKINRDTLMQYVMSRSPQSWPSISAQLDKADEASLKMQELRGNVVKQQRDAQDYEDRVFSHMGQAINEAGNSPESWDWFKKDAMSNPGIDQQRFAQRIAPFDAAIQQDPTQIARISAAMARYGQKESNVVLHQGDVLVGPTGKEIARGEEKTTKTSGIGSFEDFATRRASELGKKPEELTTDDLTAIRKEFNDKGGAEGETVPIIRINPRNGKVEQVGTAPKGAHFVNEPQPPAAGGVSGELTKDAVEDLATSYRIKGERAFPSRISGVDRGRAMNEAAVQRRLLGKTQAEEIQRQAAFQADKGALTKMRTMQSGAAVAENKALNQIDIIKDLSGKVPRTVFPLVNSALQSGRTEITGNSNATQLANAIQTFTSEYAKIIEGSTGSVAGSSDKSREASAKLVNAAMSKGTMSDVLDLMRREMRLTMQGYDTVIGDISERMGGAPEPSPAAPSTGGTSGRVGKYTYTVK